MVRISKQNKKRSVSPRRPTIKGVKSGAKKDNLAKGFKEHANAVQGDAAKRIYIGKI